MVPYIERVNSSFIRIQTDDAGLIQDLYEYFKFPDPTFVFNKFRKWDGQIRLFNKANHTIGYGLLQVVMVFMKDRGITPRIDKAIHDDLIKINKDEFDKWVSEINPSSADGLPITSHDFQLEAAFLAVKFSRLTILAATSAGKSLILYILARYYQELKDAEGSKGKMLIIVPNVSLVYQLARNFKEFSLLNNWDVDSLVHTIAEGGVKISQKPIYISTWQSLLNVEPDYFQIFSEVIVDECHLASGPSITKVCNEAVNATVRIGMTGTLKTTTLHPLQVQSLFGPIRRVVTTKQLQDRGLASKTQVVRLILNYPTAEREMVYGMDYKDEVNYLINHPFRNKVIKSLIKSQKKNTLVMFSRKEVHQKVIMNELLAEQTPDKEYLIVNGDVVGKEREAINIRMDKENGLSLLASYQTMQAGVSIKNLHVMIFAHPSKSIIQVLQSIGRMLRLHTAKETAIIYDIVDNLAYRGEPNFALQHADIRYDYYESEQHPVMDKIVTVVPQ